MSIRTIGRLDAGLDGDTVVRRCHVPVTCVPPEPEQGQPWAAVIHGATSASLLLYSPWFCGRRQVFQVELPAELARGPVFARVISCQPVSLLGGWVVACALVRYGLSEQQLRTLERTAPPVGPSPVTIALTR
jgi:hypothetical protein